MRSAAVSLCCGVGGDIVGSRLDYLAPLEIRDPRREPRLVLRKSARTCAKPKTSAAKAAPG